MHVSAFTELISGHTTFGDGSGFICEARGDGDGYLHTDDGGMITSAKI